MAKYSVIIPVYNSEQTVSRCLESLVAQGRTDVQILVINDGSSDGSEQIILEYASRYPEIEYLYQENAGVSRARNTGLEHARGQYITFVDSDDYVSQDYFSVLDQQEDCDLLVFAHGTVGGSSPDEAGLFCRLQQLDTPAERLKLLLSSRKIMSPCNKRFKRSIIRQYSLRFIEGLSVGEDFNFCTAYALRSQTMGISSARILFVDISGNHSLSRRYRPHLDDQLVGVFANVAQSITGSTIYTAQTEELLAILDYLYVKHAFSCIAEEFKCATQKKPLTRKQVADICRKFRRPFTAKRCNFIHWGLRLALKWRMYPLFYLVTYLVKGRKIQS